MPNPTSNVTSTPAGPSSWVDEVLALHPAVAAFDCDGTIWSIDAGIGFFEWEMGRDIVPSAIETRARALYAEHQAGRLSEEEFSGELVTMHAGELEQKVRAAAATYAQRHIQRSIFPDVARLIAALQAAHCEIFLVSSSHQWVIEAGARFVGVPPEQVLATTAAIVDGMITGKLTRVPNGPGKRYALEATGRTVDVAFGNSQWDTDMLAFASQAFAIHPTKELRMTAASKGWPIILPARAATDE